MKHTIFSLMFLLGTFCQTSLADDADARVALLKRYYEVADQRPFKPHKLRSFLADNYQDHNAHNPAADAKSSTINTFSSLAHGAPDSKHELIIVEAAGKNLVVVYWKYRGTHSAELLGMPATHKAFDIAGMELYKIQNGKISDIWHVEDIAGLMQQLGM